MFCSRQMQGPISRYRWLFGVLAAFFFVMLILNTTELLQGQPDRYPHERVRSLLLNVTSLCLMLSVFT
jgi:hypothetical protein